MIVFLTCWGVNSMFRSKSFFKLSHKISRRDNMLVENRCHVPCSRPVQGRNVGFGNTFRPCTGRFLPTYCPSRDRGHALLRKHNRQRLPSEWRDNLKCLKFYKPKPTLRTAKDTNRTNILNSANYRSLSLVFGIGVKT
jgi:hypothetical protein